MSKNIVVLSDGTGQVGGKGHDTNIYKLFRMLEDRTNEQIVLYDEGLGTESQKVSGMAFGRGFGKNIQECYKFMFDNYKAGDKIFLFGFSRGAATVRSLASFIHYFGILPTSRPELIREAYRLYDNMEQNSTAVRSQESAHAVQNFPDSVAPTTSVRSRVNSPGDLAYEPPSLRLVREGRVFGNDLLGGHSVTMGQGVSLGTRTFPHR